MKVSPIKLLYNAENELVVVDFGYGWRAEHNGGIERFKQALGVAPESQGLEKFAIHKFPVEMFRFQVQEFQNEKYYILGFDMTGITKPTKKKSLDSGLADFFKLRESLECKFGINAAWDQNEFIIVAHENYANDMNSLYTAFKENDIYIGCNPADSYQENILKFSIKSKVIGLPKNYSFKTNNSGENSFNDINSKNLHEELALEKELFDFDKNKVREDEEDLNSENSNQDFEYKEYNDLGKYFAFIRHEIMVRSWSHLTRLGLAHFSRKPIGYTTPDSRIHSNIRSMAECTELDQTIHNFVLGAKIDLLLNRVNFYSNLFKGGFWEDWTKYIKELLKDFKDAPENIIKSHLRYDLHYVYNEQYEQMIERIGSNEFAKILGWDKKKVSAYKNKNRLPMPVQMISATPLWTVGQAENFKRVLEFRKNNLLQSRGDWTTMIGSPLQEFKLVLIEDDIDPNERLFGFRNSEHHYFHDNSWFVHSTDNLEEAKLTAEHVFKRTKYAPEMHYALGRKYLQYDDFANALSHLEKAKQIYESIMPANFQGRIFCDDEEYVFALVYLAYIYFINDEPNKSKSLLNRVIQLQDERYTDLTGVLQKLENEPESFAEWFKEDMLS